MFKHIFCPAFHWCKETKKSISHFIENGIAPRIITGRLPSHTLPLKSAEYVVRFLLNYSEENALLLPGRVPGYSRSDLKLLPSSLSKRGILRIYHSAASLEDNIHLSVVLGVISYHL